MGRCVGLFQNVKRQFDCVTSVHNTSGGHAHVVAATDTTKIIEELVKGQVFSRRHNRSHSGFKIKKDSINREHFEQWLLAHIDKIQIQYGTHTQ